jgi:lactate dehydrogenase-like 2-hydroxyacid dehydrogenase
MTITVLYPDVDFTGEPDLERAVFGNTAQLHVFRARRAEQVPDALWQGCDAIVCYHDLPIDGAVLGRLGRCRLVVRAAVGFDNIDLAACGAKGIVVCNTPDYGTTDVADHAIALMLAVTRGIVAYNDALRVDPVKGWSYLKAPAIRRLGRQSFGVIGLGRIGTAVALRAKAFGMDVVFYDPYRPGGTELALGIRRADTFEELLCRADVVSLHAPLTDETRAMIDRAALACMKSGAILINTARGPIVDTAALLEALLAGRIAAAALDVLPTEPPQDDPLVTAWRNGDPALRDRLVLSPHAAFYSPDSYVDLRRKSAETVLAYFSNGIVRNRVN